MTMSNRSCAASIAALGFFFLTAPALGQPDEPKKPVGVYLHVDIEYMLKKAHHEHDDQATQDAFIKKRLSKLLNSSAIAGVAVGLHWSTLDHVLPSVDLAAESTCPSCVWNDLDDVFEVVNAMPDKTVQLIVTPGFDAPPWLKQRLAPCDDLFTKNSSGVGPDCGSVQFIDFNEQQRSDQWPQPGLYTLPLPWNTDYQNAWWQFLGALNRHVKDQPSLVAIAIAGPVAGSDEMILPTTLNGLDPKNGVHSKTQVGGKPADKAWTMLIDNYNRDTQHKPYPDNSNQIFVDQWTTTIAKYESLFSGLTIFLGPDSGHDYPTFRLTGPAPATKTLYGVECGLLSGQLLTSCAAKVQVIEAFLAAKGPNQKATEVGGMTAASEPEFGNIGVAGVKLLTARYDGLRETGQLIGGAQFDHAVSNLRDHEGCPSSDRTCQHTPMTVETAAVAVLKEFFHHTTVGQNYGDAPADNLNETMYYLDVPQGDIEYMEQNGCTSNTTGVLSLYQQLATANYYLKFMAGQHPPIFELLDICQPIKPPPIKPPPVQKQ